jgi:hypothetical protein
VVVFAELGPGSGHLTNFAKLKTDVTSICISSSRGDLKTDGGWLADAVITTNRNEIAIRPGTEYAAGRQPVLRTLIKGEFGETSLIL